MKSPAPSPFDVALLGPRLALERQSRDLDRVIVAKQLAMSVRQVQEIEEGGASAFYSDDHKMWAARKYAGFLRLDPYEA